MVRLNAKVHGLKIWQPLWDDFLSHHSAWLKNRRDESDEIFFLPISGETTAFICAYGCSSEDVAAEQAFLEFCRRFHIVGVRVRDAERAQENAQFIEYEGLLPRPITDSSWLERGHEVGWTDKQIENARIALRRADDMGERLLSSGGRLVCMPDFLAARNTIKAQWLALGSAERPSLPLRPSVHISTQPATFETLDRKTHV